jgi:hypothetical protein
MRQALQLLRRMAMLNEERQGRLPYRERGEHH